MRTILLAPLLLLTACSTPEKPAAPRAGAEPARSVASPEAPADALLRQYAETNRFRFGAPSALAFTPDGDALLYLRSGPRDAVRDLYALDLSTGEEALLVTADGLLGGEEEELTAEELARRERTRDAGRGLSSFSLSPDGGTLLLPLSGRLFLFDRATRAVRELESDAGFPIDARFSPDARLVASVREGDLYLQDVATGDERRLTDSEHPRVTFGEAEFIAQEEMGRRHGYWWSPDSSRIAYQRTDTRMVETFRIADPADPGKAPTEWPYPRAGTDNAEVTLHVRDLESDETVDVRWDRERHPYLATVAWPKRAPMTIVVQTRDQTESVILAVDETTGETRPLHVERDHAWIDLDQSVPHWLADGSGFLWSTERNGAWQLELRAPDGSLRRAITTPEEGYEELLAVDEDRGAVYFLARTNAIETHVARARLDPAVGRATLLTEGFGLHAGEFSDDARLWAHTGELAGGELVSVVRTAGGDVVASIPSVRETPVRDVHLEFLRLPGPRAYHASIVRPSDFDPSRRYPVIVRVYGGPTSLIVRPSESANALDQWYADQGFIVAHVDGRGTPGRGRDWLRTVRGDFISVPLADLAEAVEQLTARYPEMDADRVGVVGWSWGGYFAAMAAVRLPEVFDAAVAGAPVVDWLDYDTHYTERYLGVPGEPGVDYWTSNVLLGAEELRTPLLLIHGTADDNVYFTHSAKLADALLRAGRDFDFLPLAGQTHAVTDPEVVVPMHRRIASFFREHLGPVR